MMPSEVNELPLISLCRKKGLRVTRQRRIIAKVLDRHSDHQDADAVYSRVRQADRNIAFSTVYRTLRFFEDNGLLDGQSFGQRRRHYERTDRPHHDHLIDVDTGEIIEFHSSEIEQLQAQIVEKLGYDLVSHRLELFGRRKAGGSASSLTGQTNPLTKNLVKTPT